MHYVWIGLIGLVMGALAGQVLKGHFNIFLDMIVGVLGALGGGYVFLTYLQTWANLKVGVYIFAAIGAGLALLAWRSLRSVD